MRSVRCNVGFYSSCLSKTEIQEFSSYLIADTHSVHCKEQSVDDLSDFTSNMHYKFLQYNQQDAPVISNYLFL